MFGSPRRRGGLGPDRCRQGIGVLPPGRPTLVNPGVAYGQDADLAPSADQDRVVGHGHRSFLGPAVAAGGGSRIGANRSARSFGGRRDPQSTCNRPGQVLHRYLAAVLIAEAGHPAGRDGRPRCWPGSLPCPGHGAQAGRARGSSARSPDTRPPVGTPQARRQADAGRVRGSEEVPRNLVAIGRMRSLELDTPPADRSLGRRNRNTAWTIVAPGSRPPDPARSRRMTSRSRPESRRRNGRRASPPRSIPVLLGEKPRVSPESSRDVGTVLIVVRAGFGVHDACMLPRVTLDGSTGESVRVLALRAWHVGPCDPVLTSRPCGSGS
jgi:hypothetical protein